MVMRKTLHKGALFFIVLWSVVILPGVAQAQTASLACASGIPVASTQLYDTGGPSNDDGFCEYTGPYHIFSQVICDFVIVLNNVLGNVYCSMQYVLSGIIAMVITVYIAVYGVQLLMGTAQLNTKDFMVHLLKIACVWTFISYSAWGIGLAFYFFFSLAADGVLWVMTAINVDSFTDPSSVCYDAAASSASGFMNAFVRLDEVICNAVVDHLVNNNEKVVGFFIGLGLLLWPIGALILYWVWLNLSVMIRGLITFLLGMSALAFLIALAPIFLSLMLFQTTYRFFETWLRYMISFTLPVILMFACIAMWLLASLYFVEFFGEIADTIYPHQVDEVTSNIHNDKNQWGFCSFNYWEDDPFNPPGSPGYLPGPYVECKTPVDIFPVSALLMSSTDPAAPECTNMEDGTNDCTKYLYYVLYHLITLIIVCYAFEALMRQAPMIAVYLAGPEYTPMLGKGFGTNRYGQFRQIGTSDSKSSSGGLFGGNKGGGQKSAASTGSPPEGTGKAQQLYQDTMSQLLGKR